MLDSFHIHNFRLFKNFSIEKLGQLNLITGKNNSGKSCLLEALYLYAKNVSPTVLYEIITSREEDWEERLQRRNNKSDEVESPFRYLFYGYHLPQAGKDSIEIGPLSEMFKIHVSAYQRIEMEEKRIISRVDMTQQNYGELDNVELAIELEENSNFRRLFFLNRDIRDQIRLPFIRMEQDRAKYNVQYIPASQFNNNDASILWDNINIHPKLRQEVFRGLQIIDNRIQEIVKISDSREATFILIYRDSNERLPLNSMGDGMIHLFHVILGLVNAREGILLIDEFENGLHYEVQYKIWELIFELAKQLNIQVFATTHSNDTIDAFRKVASSIQYNTFDTKYIKLKPLVQTGTIKSVELDVEQLGSILDQRIEVR